MILLELFSGTHSVGKVAKKLGYKVISVDINEKSKPDVVADILKLKYKKLPVPDFIWASPPCNTFSTLVSIQQNPARDIKSGKALTDKGREGDKILKKTIKIYKYFKSKNPDLKIAIENPRGAMRLQPIIKQFYRNTITYCSYGFKVRKPTDIFTNYEVSLKPKCKKEDKHKHVKVLELSLNERYKIPPKLIKSLLIQLKNAF